MEAYFLKSLVSVHLPFLTGPFSPFLSLSYFIWIAFTVVSLSMGLCPEMELQLTNFESSQGSNPFRPHCKLLVVIQTGGPTPSSFSCRVYYITNHPKTSSITVSVDQKFRRSLARLILSKDLSRDFSQAAGQGYILISRFKWGKTDMTGCLNSYNTAVGFPQRKYYLRQPQMEVSVLLKPNLRSGIQSLLPYSGGHTEQPS